MLIKPAWENKRTIYARAEEDVNLNLGLPPEQRNLQQKIKRGLIIIDKVPGPTSHEVAAWIKKLMEIDHVGHGGTLDPNVTGVLPVCLEDSTKIVQALLDSGKEYVTIMRTHENVSENQVVNTLKLFIGEIYQRPPLRSAVSRRLRIRTIYNIDYLEGDGRNWLFKVSCQSGTYIRKLCADVGELLGCGAHMHELRRTRSGPFIESQAVTFYDLVDALDLMKEGDEKPLMKMIYPIEDALSLLPHIWIRDSAVEAICTGAQLAMPGILRFESGIELNGLVAVMTQRDEAISLMRAEMSSDDMLKADHGIAASPERVIMIRGTYPKTW
ncbi:RNA-guided pseudouridylation complex pseudouridine synthase subunit Cbf5 [Candidatus Bathyarchaeota archaeon]|nr:RNA-guided pseudouridylation complex pseudouridine synthase subunit Cbf5 [Candidatus Bathyarchaeota archaeon]